ncbi:MAG: adenylosuccinate lyase [Bacteroidales bacterium]|jgi:adenylosuccinate lyase|nr:adenylosuccinate lyase [Bacteroidales bacterium]
MNQLRQLTSVSPVDGRYGKTTEILSNYFSEYALIKARVNLEVEYFIALCEIPLPQLNEVDKALFPKLRDVVENFSHEDALRIKEIEKTTNHDVKAVEYFLKEVFDKIQLSEYKEFIHFGLTSQDVNNTAVPWLNKAAHFDIIMPALEEILQSLNEKVELFRDVPILARTHGQPASPSRLDKEIYVFIDRLKNQIAQFQNIPFSGKFGGATGNFNAHHVAYPEIDWIEFGNMFLEKHLGLERQQVTTQIEHYDMMAAWFDNLKRINTILIDLDRDMWTYISMEYFKQKTKEGEVGSSAMPHKVNPIDFENSEGNLGIANAFFEFLATKLPISRLQRDLTDSTVSRNIGVPVAHSLIGYKSLLRGLSKIELNNEAMNQDLEKNWAVVAEAIQTILRREMYPNPYEALKDLTRGKEGITKESIHQFVDTLNVSDEVKTELKQITPQNYIGVFKK